MNNILGVLSFGDREWTPSDGLKSALSLTRSIGERRELERLADLALAGRLMRREMPTGDVTYPVVKAAEIRGITNAEQRRIEIVASDKSVDRYGDTINPTGWKVDNYHRNPVVLIDHDYTVASIVGHSPRQWVDGDRYMMEDVIDPAGTNAAADMMWAKIVNRSLRAVSVGFRALKWAKRLDHEGNWIGFDFLEQDLLEKSWVAVPANPNATLSTPGPERTPATAALRDAHEAAVRLDNRITAAGILARLEN